MIIPIIALLEGPPEKAAQQPLPQEELPPDPEDRPLLTLISSLSLEGGKQPHHAQGDLSLSPPQRPEPHSELLR